jgi:hypothetical protein
VEEFPLKNEYSRREAIKLDIGTAALGVAGSAISAAATEPTLNP